MSGYTMGDTKRAIERVLHEAHGPLAAADFLRRIVERGYEPNDVVSAVREMFEAGDIRFDADMQVCLTRELV